MIRISLIVATLLAFGISLKAQDQPFHKFSPLPYSYDALEPYIDKMTMEIHYDRHHRAYYNNFLSTVKGTSLESTAMEDIFALMSSYPVAVRNNGGGYWNHTLFWNCMKPNGGGVPKGKLGEAVDKSFGTFDDFKKAFSDAAAKRFGSGWAWLSVKADGSLFVSSTANQDNPLMNTEEKRGIPIFCLDVWEHAYYLKYQNKRGDYISSFWNVANWDFAEQQYEKALNAVKK